MVPRTIIVHVPIYATPVVVPHLIPDPPFCEAHGEATHEKQERMQDTRCMTQKGTYASLYSVLPTLQPQINEGTILHL